MQKTKATCDESHCTQLQLHRPWNFPREQVREFARGAFLHDVGLNAIPDAILRMSDTLTPDETAIMQTHPFRGYELVKKIPFLAEASEIVYSHHERYDGTGYPRGLKGARYRGGTDLRHR
jgi:HD-GYP domain-containing protein (c-di-GMP phosphodiesterase class II)